MTRRGVPLTGVKNQKSRVVGWMTRAGGEATLTCGARFIASARGNCCNAIPTDWHGRPLDTVLPPRISGCREIEIRPAAVSQPFALADSSAAILLKNSIQRSLLLRCAEVDVSDRPRIDGRECAKGARTHQQVPVTATDEFFNRIQRMRPVAVGKPTHENWHQAVVHSPSRH